MMKYLVAVQHSVRTRRELCAAKPHLQRLCQLTGVVDLGVYHTVHGVTLPRLCCCNLVPRAMEGVWGWPAEAPQLIRLLEVHIDFD